LNIKKQSNITEIIIKIDNKYLKKSLIGMLSILNGKCCREYVLWRNFSGYAVRTLIRRSVTTYRVGGQLSYRILFTPCLKSAVSTCQIFYLKPRPGVSNSYVTDLNFDVIVYIIRENYIQYAKWSQPWQTRLFRFVGL